MAVTQNSQYLTSKIFLGLSSLSEINIFNIIINATKEVDYNEATPSSAFGDFIMRKWRSVSVKYFLF